MAIPQRTAEIIAFVRSVMVKGRRVGAARMVMERFGVNERTAAKLVYQAGMSDHEWRKRVRISRCAQRARQAVRSEGLAKRETIEETAAALIRMSNYGGVHVMTIRAAQIRLGCSDTHAQKILTIAKAQDMAAKIEHYRAQGRDALARFNGYADHADRIARGPGNGHGGSHCARRKALPSPASRQPQRVVQTHGPTPVADPVHAQLAALVPAGYDRDYADEIVSRAWLAIATGEASIEDVRAAIRMGRRGASIGVDFSLDAKIGEDGGMTWLELIEDEGALDAFDDVLDRIDREREDA